MIGVLLFLNSRGDILLSRAFRDGLSIRHLADTFKQQVVTPRLAERCPVNIIDRVAYFHIRQESMYVVACTHQNANAFVVFQYLTRLVSLLCIYYNVCTQNIIKENFVTIQEIIDESLDFGYPQITEATVLKSYISALGMKSDVVKKVRAAEEVTIKATGKIPWRREGIVYRENEVFLEVMEDINLLMNQDCEVLQRDVFGLIRFKGFLSGMPDCQLIINDKMLLNGERGIELDDVTFHSCVRLNTFDNNRSITFVPPDGEFVLLTYRTSNAVKPPIRVMLPRVKEVSKTRMEIDFMLKPDFPPNIAAIDVVVTIPCPENTANVTVRVKKGKAKYDATQQSIVWKVRSLEGDEEVPFSAEVALIAATLQRHEKVWSRPPISIKFRAPMFAASGIKVQQLTITEPKMNYSAKKWVKYQTNGGEYQCRL